MDSTVNTLQAADTDISALVEIEKNSRHRFEFFMGLVGDQPICARTAWAYIKSGGPISHSLSVYSCQLRQASQVSPSCATLSILTYSHKCTYLTTGTVFTGEDNI